MLTSKEKDPAAGVTRMGACLMEPVIKVTRINDKYHARCFVDGKCVNEMACVEKADIQFICREMLRWLQKLGLNNSNYVDRARHRKSSFREAIGKVWYKKQLEEKRKKPII